MRNLEKASIKIDLSDTIGLKEEVFELNEETGKMEFASDNYVFYHASEYTASDPESSLAYRFDVSSEIGKIIENTKDAYQDFERSPFSKIINVQKNTADDYKTEKVMCVIITDGEENSSREYSAEKIKVLIEQQKTEYGREKCFY